MNNYNKFPEIALWLALAIVVVPALSSGQPMAGGQLEAVEPQSSATSSSRDTARGLADDVTKSFGSYEYMPQPGIYRDLTLGDVADDFVSVMSAAGASVYNLNRYAGWIARGASGDLSWNLGGGAGNFYPPMVGLNMGYPYTANNQGRLRFVAGPLILDSFYLGYGAIYTDLSGSFPGRQFLPDDGWAQIVWLSFRASFVLGNSIGVSIQPMLYWLPNTNEVGWGLPGPFAGLFMPQPNLGAMAEIRWAKQLGRWRIAAYDSLTPMLSQLNLWTASGWGSYQAGDLSPIDRVGRYGFGFGAGDVTSYDPQARFSSNPGDWDGLDRFMNLFGVTAYGDHGPALRSNLYFNRFDLYDRDFRGIFSAIQGGAWLRHDRQLSTFYTGYEFASGEPYDRFMHTATVGVQKRFSPYLSGYVQGGAFWVSGDGVDQHGWLGATGFSQRIGEHTWHMVEVGRRAFQPGNQLPGIENFGQYRITHQLGSGSGITGIAGISERRQDFQTENDVVLKYAGILYNLQASDRVSLFASAGWEAGEIEAGPLEYQRWTYRFGASYLLTSSTSLQSFYQYEDVRGTFDYTEHFLYLGAAKRF